MNSSVHTHTLYPTVNMFEEIRRIRKKKTMIFCGRKNLFKTVALAPGFEFYLGNLNNKKML